MNLPEGWKITTLGEVSEFINGDRGKNYPNQKDFITTGIPFINAGHIQNGNINFDSMNYISDQKFNCLGSGKVQHNDILYCLRGSLGKNAIVNDIKKGAIASSLVIIRPHKNISTKYLYYFLNSPLGKTEIYKYDNGSSQPNLSAKSVKSYKIPLPPIASQRRIADILDKADEIIRKRKEAIALTEQLQKSIFLDMFGDPLQQNQDKIRLSEIAKIIMGQSPKGESYNTKGQGVPLLNGPAEFGDNHPIEKQWTNKPTRICESGDILFCVRGATAGRLNWANKEYCIGRGLAAIRPIKTNKNYSEFIYFTLEQLYQYFQDKGVGSTFININRKEIENLLIPKIDREKADKFYQYAIELRKIKYKNKKSLEESENLFNSLLQKAFKGEL